MRVSNFQVIQVNMFLLMCFLTFFCYAGNVVETSEGFVFTEDFIWQGNHAASILNGASTTTWWDEASWDARGDTGHTAVSEQSASINNRFHVDVHKANSNDPTDGQLSNTLFVVGGNGDSGVGVMHLDFQDILSARLRNPLLVSAQQPGVIEFYASAFVTTAHWWEVAISPATEIIGAEYSSVPGQGDNGLPGPLVGSGAQPGPGHDSPLDSINVISFGATDVPCITGWRTRFGITKTDQGVTTHHVNQVAALSSLTQTDPADADKLEHWRLEVTPSSISLLLDAQDNNQFELVESWSLSVPWPEVYVHLMAVAYQADHHPQEPCYLGHIRELKWRDVKVWPVKYAKTDVYPKNQGVIPVGRNEGWMSYDIRDIQRFGADVNNAPQPNLTAFATDHAGRYCNDAGYPCFGNVTTASLNLPVPPDPAGLILADAKVLADLKRGFAATEWPVSVDVDALQVGAFIPANVSVGVGQGAWVRRGLDIPVAHLSPGSDQTVHFMLGENAYLDRIEVELLYDSSNVVDLIFAHGFE